MNGYAFVSFTHIDIRFINLNLGDVDNLSTHLPPISREKRSNHWPIDPNRILPAKRHVLSVQSNL